MCAGKIVHKYQVICGGKGKPFSTVPNAWSCHGIQEWEGPKKSCEAVFRTMGWQCTSQHGWLCPDCADIYAKLKEQKVIGKVLRHGKH